MTRLTRAKQITRASAVGVGLAIVLLSLGSLGLKLLNTVTVDKQAALAKIKPDVAFGAIPQPVLNQAQVDLSAANLRLDLVSGAYPQSTTSARVYKAGQPILSLSAQDRARARAQQLGFNSNPAQPNPDTFTWNDGLRTLTINLKDQTFTLNTNPANINFATRTTFNRFDPIQQRITQYIGSQFTYLDLQTSQPQTNFVNAAGSVFLPQDPEATAPSNFVQGTILRQPINNTPIYSASGKIGPINLIVVPQRLAAKPNNGLDQDQILQLSSSYQVIDQTTSATYPAISPQAAFQMLTNQMNKYLVSVQAVGTVPATNLVNADTLFVTYVYLEPDSSNPVYVQPAWMFEGRGSSNAGDVNWVAYVPAIDFPQTQTLLTGQK